MQRRSFLNRITMFLLIFVLVFSVPPYSVPASVSSAAPEESSKNRTTMYVSSTLCGRYGLCVLLENVDSSGKKKYGLIDTGNPNQGAAKKFLDDHGVKTLEFMLLTHMHRDHAGNAAWIIKNYKVKSLYLKQFDANWSDGIQSIYEDILRAAVTSPNLHAIHGVSYALSKSKTASPKASKKFVSFLNSHEKAKWRFKGLFNESNTALYLGQTSLRLYNWEIWAADGTSRWIPGKTVRCKVNKYAADRSDNHFSMGVRVTRGSNKIWIGGDITNLRLKKKHHSSWKGDEDRLGSQIGKVDVAVLNHHGRGGSNTKKFLNTLSPRYVIYTSAKADITSSGSNLAASTLDYIRKGLKIPENNILWAYSCWGVNRDDQTVTIYSDKIAQSVSSSAGTNAQNTAKKAQSAAKQKNTAAAEQKNTAAAKQTETADAKQKEAAAAKQTETADAKQKEAAAAKQTETADAKQNEAAAAKQTEAADAKQNEATAAKQTEAAAAKQTEAADAKQKEAADAKQNETTAAKQNETATANTLVVPLLPGKTCSSYDVTGDGKKDVVTVTAAKSGSAYKGLSISVNKKIVWSTGISFKDTQPVTLVRLSGRQSCFCISLLSPADNTAKGRILGLYRYSKSTAVGSGSQYVLAESYNLLKQMPVNNYVYCGMPAIACKSGQITIMTRGSDSLSANAFVTFVLKEDKNGLKTVTASFPYTTAPGKKGTVTLKTSAKLFKAVNDQTAVSALAAGSTVTVTRVFRNKAGITRYRIIDSGKKEWWINAPAAR